MKKTTVRIVFGLLAATYVLTHFLGHAHAQSSLGIGANEAVLPSTGMFAGLLNWINVHQQQFYRALTGSLKSMRDGGGGQWLLVALSFAYGVFHAAGPGHGKAVISSYMLANEVALRRGVLLSFISALLQAVTAILVMTLVYFVLRGTAISMTDATRFLEIASYAMVTAFGLWLLWQKAVPRLAGAFGMGRAHSLSAAAAHAHHHDHAEHHHHHAHGPSEVCSSCGHSHAPDPALLSTPAFNWRSAWAAVTAVGLRPCTGALIVLSFAFLNGLWVAGVVSVLAMAVGTALTVSLLAVLAVSAKNVAVRFAGDGRMGNRIHAAIEIGGAALVFLLGVTLLAATI
ncbi:MAG TPA: nickel/cobalt transporter [Rhizobiaceae bacterium]|nr:nickel/cobalt transporter [Rhizobiaceae bacterium]